MKQTKSGLEWTKVSSLPTFIVKLRLTQPSEEQMFSHMQAMIS